MRWLLRLVMVAALALTGCTSPVRTVHLPPSTTKPATSDTVPLAMASDRGILLEDIPWCDDPDGNSAAGLWPCQWNRSSSPAPGWDPIVPNIAIFVRAADGCPDAIDTGNRPWSCYWRPQDQAGATS